MINFNYCTALKNSITIPLNKQDASATNGITVKYMRPVITKDTEQYANHDVFDKHMDDYYIILMVTKGNAIMHCGMENITISANGLLVIKPFQVHGIINISDDIEGYFTGIESFLIPAQCRAVFNNLAPKQQFLHLTPQQTLVNTVKLLHETSEGNNLHKNAIINGLFTAYIHQVAALYEATSTLVESRQNQAATITEQFNTLLSQHSFLELPSFFAQKLNITTAHLNHCLKTTTGFTITHWLQEAMINEAKQLIYYTDNDIKQIAYILGYQDHAYFARQFKKITGQTPLAFRKKFRE
ncbi:helix-turn-helix domain-containing protein [Flavobacterium zepuense]|uniref:Helix-turn-helix domain-containing protein n=1 Tax=Flavobacterium zepuense TaxID=2593302 RepID=A0A552V2H2_9FLAO|nr:helix-turn-helix domain-containing protein [Flavobacterium zepuense]TRW24663.1 helix-turn-helix domain-containing protein [Flavobacterium zepuense]